VLTIAVVPGPVFTDFVHATVNFASFSAENPFNSSFPAVLQAFDLEGGVLPVLWRILTVVVVAGCGWRLRHAEVDLQWAWAWLAVLLFVPLVWWHYLWLVIPAIVLSLASRPRLTARDLHILPLVAVVIAALTFANGEGAIVAGLQWFVLVAAVVTVALRSESHDLERGDSRGNRTEASGSAV
jgi:hypothetical protein